MPRSCAFYATDTDLLPLLLDIEAQAPVDYICLPDIWSPDLMRYASAGDIPQLLETPTGTLSRQMFIVDRGHAPEPVGQLHVSDRMRYRLGPPQVGRGLCFDEYGLHPGGALLPSRLYTVGADADVLRRFNRFDRRLRRAFYRVRGWPVGPQAHHLLMQGMRLTAFLTAPPEADLRPE